MHAIWPLDIADIVVVAAENAIDEMRKKKKWKKNRCRVVAIYIYSTGERRNRD